MHLRRVRRSFAAARAYRTHRYGFDLYVFEANPPWKVGRPANSIKATGDQAWTAKARCAPHSRARAVAREVAAALTAAVAVRACAEARLGSAWLGRRPHAQRLLVTSGALLGGYAREFGMHAPIFNNDALLWGSFNPPPAESENESVIDLYASR